MSNRALNWAFEQTTGSSTIKLVLLKLADQANDDGRCWPSLRWIVKHTELSERAIRDSIRRLEKLGLLFTVHRRDETGSINLTNIYQLKIRENVPVGQVVPQGGAGGAPGVGQDVPPNPKVKPSIKPLAANTQKRKTEAPQEFLLTEDLKTWAKEQGLSFGTLEKETPRFLDYHRAKGTTFKNWGAAWKNWMRNVKEWSKDKGDKSINNMMEGAL